jgi:hypothetical protein
MFFERIETKHNNYFVIKEDDMLSHEGIQGERYKQLGN